MPEAEDRETARFFDLFKIFPAFYFVAQRLTKYVKQQVQGRRSDPDQQPLFERIIIERCVIKGFVDIGGHK